MRSAPTCPGETERCFQLASLRRLLGFSQLALARILNVSQPCIAQVEGQEDMHLTTLRRYVEALGGELELIARFPDNSVEISLHEVIKTSPSHSISQQKSGGMYANKPIQ